MRKQKPSGGSRQTAKDWNESDVVFVGTSEAYKHGCPPNQVADEITKSELKALREIGGKLEKIGIEGQGRIILGLLLLFGKRIQKAEIENEIGT